MTDFNLVCPNCGFKGPFETTVQTYVTVHGQNDSLNNGSVDEGARFWNSVLIPDSYMKCLNCLHYDKTSTFMVKE